MRPCASTVIVREWLDQSRGTMRNLFVGGIDRIRGKEAFNSTCTRISFFSPLFRFISNGGCCKVFFSYGHLTTITYYASHSSRAVRKLTYRFEDGLI